MPTRRADFDGDLDVDGDDLRALAACASGPAVSLVPGCQSKDLDDDGDADKDEFGLLQRCYSGAGKPAKLRCAD